MPLTETRTVAAQAEIREVAGEGQAPELRFSGHAAVFNQRTWIGPKQWGFWERVDPAFFRDVLTDDAAFLVNHDPNIVLARNPTTMKLSIDERGLVADAEWDPADPDAQKWAGRVKRGDVGQMSFAFTVAEEKWEVDADSGEETRTLLTADKLYDASLVTYPAYSGTDGGMRAAAEVVKRHRGVDPLEDAPAGRPVRATDPAPAVPTEPLQPAEPAPVPAQPVNPVNPVPQTEPAPIDKPTVPIVEPVSALRHRLLGLRYGLPVTVREIIPVGGAEQLGATGDDEDEDEDFSTDAGILAEIVENHQDTVAAAVEYLADSDPATRNPAVVTFVQNLIGACNADITAVAALLA